MSWEWSHTVEAYQDARDNLEALTMETLKEIYVEWKVHDKNNDWELAAEIDRQAEILTHSDLFEYVWERMDEQRTCTNGGWYAWACPYGCECHTVAFNVENVEHAGA